MKTHLLKDTVLAVLILIVVLQMVTLFFTINHEVLLPSNQEAVFIWNDDEESIPPDGSPITLEFSKGNVIYIGPYVTPKELRPTTDSLMKEYLNRSHVE